MSRRKDTTGGGAKPPSDRLSIAVPASDRLILGLQAGVDISFLRAQIDKRYAAHNALVSALELVDDEMEVDRAVSWDTVATIRAVLALAKGGGA